MDITFPKEFVWGASTASYQIEGAWNKGGRAPSIWDTFSHAGKVANNDTGDDACNHYERYQEDVQLMAELGLGAYRFSTSWSRIFPEGRGKPNSKGIDFYERLTDELSAKKIDPWLCFYHWDLPQVLQDKGGWANRDMVYWFADYAAFVAERFGDRVKHFAMLNEPNVHALVGHLLGMHAPGLTDFMAFSATTHHLNLATGFTLERLRSMDSNWQLGTILNLQPAHPATDKDEDIEAATTFDAFWNRNCLEPLFKGSYPERTVMFLEPYIQENDLRQIQQPLDFLGLNLYTRVLIQADNSSLVGVSQAPLPDNAEITAMDWEVYPEALYEQLIDLKENYDNPKIFVTENGAAFTDRVSQGRVHDEDRVDFLRKHLTQLYRAREDGVNVEGYFVWSLLDNFEWAEGYEKRFGIIYVDYETHERRPKASYYWYQSVIKEGGFD